MNFGNPMPIFPLDSVSLLPQQILPLHIFEPRYRQMIEHVLDGPGQIAMAVFSGESWKQQYHGLPPVRPYVCVGQIAQHERLSDGRYNLLLQGVCRARIRQEFPPSDDRLYRLAMLAPTRDVPVEEDSLSARRDALESMLSSEPLSRLSASEPILEYVRNEDVPATTVFELLGFALLHDTEQRYRLLSEPDPSARAGIIERELTSLQRLIRQADRQKPGDWPKGCSWN